MPENAQGLTFPVQVGHDLAIAMGDTAFEGATAMARRTPAGLLIDQPGLARDHLSDEPLATPVSDLIHDVWSLAIIGCPGSGLTVNALRLATQQIARGGHVIYIDVHPDRAVRKAMRVLNAHEICITQETPYPFQVLINGAPEQRALRLLSALAPKSTFESASAEHYWIKTRNLLTQLFSDVKIPISLDTLALIMGTHHPLTDHAAFVERLNEMVPFFNATKIFDGQTLSAQVTAPGVTYISVADECVTPQISSMVIRLILSELLNEGCTEKQPSVKPMLLIDGFNQTLKPSESFNSVIRKSGFVLVTTFDEQDWLSDQDSRQNFGRAMYLRSISTQIADILGVHRIAAFPANHAILHDGETGLSRYINVT
ncbi:hypothetical protein HAP94_06490 [Acidithiobacillus ferrivorans]|nr:hypothetical protein [Acidithiobacillus ferrivorans]